MKRKKTILLICLAMLVTIQSASFRVNRAISEENHDANAMWLAPSLVELNASETTVGYQFNITVWGNVSEDFRGWQIWLLYNKTYINATDCWYSLADGSGSTSGPSEFMADAGSTLPVTPGFIDYNATHDRVDFGEAWISGDNASAKAGRCAIVEFEVVGLPMEGKLVEIALDIKWAYENMDPPKTYLLKENPGGNTVFLTMDVYNGLVEFAGEAPQVEGHDVAVMDVNISSNSVLAGETLHVNVTVRNQGNFTESFNVTVSYDDSTIGTKSVNSLEPNYDSVLTFEWDTSGVQEGNYTIKAEADQVEGETNLNNNSLEDGIVEVQTEAAVGWSLPSWVWWVAPLLVLVIILLIVWFYRRKKG